MVSFRFSAILAFGTVIGMESAAGTLSRVVQSKKDSSLKARCETIPRVVRNHEKNNTQELVLLLQITEN